MHGDYRNVLKCAAVHYNQNTFTPRHTLYPEKGILPSSRSKSDILFEHNHYLSLHIRILMHRHILLQNYFRLNTTNSTAS